MISFSRRIERAQSASAPRRRSCTRLGHAARGAPLLTALLAVAAPLRANDAFPLGVAAGDARESSAILWTAVADAPRVRCEVSADARFETLVFVADADSDDASDRTVRLTAGGLAPGTDYWYRFLDPRSGAVSETGRFRSAPGPAAPTAFRFAFSGDTNFQSAPFRLMSDLAAQAPDLFIWFGDLIYADAPAGGLGVAQSLDEYRAKYRQLRGDEHVRAALAATALWAGWDDHELGNDYAGLDPNLPTEQRAAAYQAFFEHVPIERGGPAGDADRTYRRLRYGAHAEFFFLDERQYRQPSAARECRGNLDPEGFVLGGLTRDGACLAALRGERSMLGAAQMEWLLDGLRTSDARWKFVVNNVPLSYLGVFPYDRWDGYDAERRALLEFIDAAAIEGVVFLTTDIHANGYNPDVGGYFRARRADYALSGSVVMRELIVGPLGNATAHETLTGAAPALLRPLLGILEQSLLARVRRANGLAFIDADKLSYALIEIDAGGELSFRYRGISPGQETADARVFFDSDAPPQPPACGLGLLPALAVAPGLLLNRLAARRAGGRTDVGAAGFEPAKG